MQAYVGVEGKSDCHLGTDQNNIIWHLGLIFCWEWIQKRLQSTATNGNFNWFSIIVAEYSNVSLIRSQTLKETAKTFTTELHTQSFFDVLLTVHLSIIVVINQLDAQIFVLRVSSTMCLKHVEASNKLIIKQQFGH